MISREAEGTTFVVILPASASDASSSAASGDLEMPGYERILFIDDEEPIAKFAKAAMERIGYRVTAMSDSAAACALFEENPNQFDVVITDLSMPGLSGEALIKRIKAIRPSIPVIVCTGFCDASAEKSTQAMGIDACLMKPFSRGVLSTTVRKVMGNGSGAGRKAQKEHTLPC